MQYPEALQSLSIFTLRNIALNLGLWAPEPRPKRGNKEAQAEERKMLQQRLLQFYQKPLLVSQLINNLSAEEKLALEVILYNMDGVPGTPMRVAQRRLAEMLGSLSLAHKSCEKLVNLGLVFSKEEYWDFFYKIPEEVVHQTYHLTARKLADRLVPAAAVQASGADPFLPVRDMHVFLAATILTNPRVTSQGRFHRQDLKKIAAFFTGAGEDHLHLLTNLAIGLNLLETDGETIFPTPEVWEWAAQPWTRQWEELANFCTGLIEYGDDDPLINLPVRHLLNLLGQFPADSFLPVDDLVALLVELGGRKVLDGEPDPPQAQIPLAVKILSWLGIVENAAAASGLAIRQNRELPPPEEPWEKKLIVQPDFEILADQKLAPHLLWELCQFADLLSADRVSRLRLTRDSLYRAWQAGKELPEIISFLQQHSKFPLPQNVEASLQDWYREMGRISVYRAAIIHCATPELAEELKVSRGVSPHIVGQITPEDLLVPIEEAEEVLTAVQRAGYLPETRIFELTPNKKARKEKKKPAPQKG